MLSHVEVYRQTKVWSRLVDDLFVVNIAEWLEDVEMGIAP